jgi:uncharacterized metal-binding protein YceD (DUF177 family)
LILEPLKEYKIQFSGLSDGIHQYSYDIKDSFFENFEHTIVSGGHLKVDLELDKRPTLLTLNFSFEGSLQTDCDRCAVTAPYPVEGEARLIIQLTDGESDDDDLIYLPNDAFEYNIAQYLYETLALSLPLRVVHCEVSGDKSICDQKVIDYLDALSVPEPEEEPESDPRWDALKGLSGDK